MSKEFFITDAQEAKLNKWLTQVKKEVCEEQMAFYRDAIINRRDDDILPIEWYQTKLSFIESCYREDKYYPYEGASGGGLSYTFVPTGLGMAVSCNYFGREIDLTDLNSWG
jgi:hypothetical protein